MSEMLYTQTTVDCKDHQIAANQMYRTYFSNLKCPNQSGPIYCIYQKSFSCSLTEISAQFNVMSLCRNHSISRAIQAQFS